MTKKQMTICEFLRTPNVYPLTEGEPYLCIQVSIIRAIPPDVEILFPEFQNGKKVKRTG